MKDLVDHPNKKYEHIYKIISKENKQHKIDDQSSSSEISLLPVQPEEKSMKDELKNFLKNQLKNNDSLYYQFK